MTKIQSLQELINARDSRISELEKESSGVQATYKSMQEEKEMLIQKYNAQIRNIIVKKAFE